MGACDGEPGTDKQPKRAAGHESDQPAHKAGTFLHAGESIVTAPNDNVFGRYGNRSHAFARRALLSKKIPHQPSSGTR